jgi:methylenetetrahydrofolate dehydrogenase (NADP+) / methenyltetrahydrofolate cyclohydrolase
MIVDGRKIAEGVYAELTARVAHLPHPPRLGIIVAGNDPVTSSFVDMKSSNAQRLGVQLSHVQLSDGANTEDVLIAIQKLTPNVDGMIVQLPLPGAVDINGALSAIPDDKDVDAISTATGEHWLDSPVARAVVEILQRSGVDPKGRKTVVVGAGRLVGTPVANLLKKLGADVLFFTLDQGSIEDLKQADIVVSGAGTPNFIKPEHLKQGVALIDAGTSEQGGNVVGDCDPRCAEVASVFTPVPGGVGPVAVAMIFKNLFDLMEGGK